MIFSGNTTALGASTIPMAEGYDCSYGASLALVESARNDLAMFKALVLADYKEMSIYRESTGAIQEGEISALHEAVGSGIFKKIADLFRKLIGKIKGIFHNLFARLNGLIMKDKALVKKYEKELGRKSNLDNLEVKWRKIKDKKLLVTEKESSDELNKSHKGIFEGADGWNEDRSERIKKYTGYDDLNDYYDYLIEECLEDEDVVKLNEIGGWRKIANWLKTFNASNIEKFVKNTSTSLEKIVKEYDDRAKKAASESINNSEDPDKITASDNANHAYDMALAFQDVMMTETRARVDATKIVYKQHKAAFMKAVTVNEKKLEESSIYAEAVAEAAEQEVDDVISSALSNEEISDLSAASVDVKDGDVKDDPDALTYGPNYYTKNASMNGSNGSINARIGGGKVEESAYFGKLFY